MAIWTLELGGHAVAIYGDRTFEQACDWFASEKFRYWLVDDTAFKLWDLKTPLVPREATEAEAIEWRRSRFQGKLPAHCDLAIFPGVVPSDEEALWAPAKSRRGGAVLAACRRPAPRPLAEARQLMDDAEADVLAYMTFPTQHRSKLHSTDEIDKRFLPVVVFFRLRGRPRGEARRIGWKRRQAAYSSLAGLRRPRTFSFGERRRQARRTARSPPRPVLAIRISWSRSSLTL